MLLAMTNQLVDTMDKVILSGGNDSHNVSFEPNALLQPLHQPSALGGSRLPPQL